MGCIYIVRSLVTSVLIYGSIFSLKVTHIGKEDTELSEYQDESASILLTPKKYLIPFFILFLPVIASIIIASTRHEFSFFYFLIPGVWCYGVGCLLIKGICNGRISDSHGTAIRSKSPIRFWGKISVWFLFYLFATAFPIGYAIQEHNNVETEHLATQDPGEFLTCCEN